MEPSLFVAHTGVVNRLSSSVQRDPLVFRRPDLFVRLRASLIRTERVGRTDPGNRHARRKA